MVGIRGRAATPLVGTNGFDIVRTLPRGAVVPESDTRFIPDAENVVLYVLARGYRSSAPSPCLLFPVLRPPPSSLSPQPAESHRPIRNRTTKTIRARFHPSAKWPRNARPEPSGFWNKFGSVVVVGSGVRLSCDFSFNWGYCPRAKAA